MANEIDERIVEARFDSSDFEKGVNKTIGKLNELKQSLNLKDSGKSITEFAKETSENVDKAGNALQRLSDRFTTFKGMIKQQILGGLASEISNVFLSIEQSLLRFTKSISSDQVSAGMNKYTEILNSVRTMTAAGVNQDTAYDNIKRLAEYSDQTSYSLSQMTSGMSKLVAAGMDVSKAEKSMEGLANMCASAGVNIYEAQRAFLNFSQAYSSGKMRIQDWTSFETLNMATEPVMKIFMQAAEQVGNLTKTIDKNGKEVYKTTNKINKEIKNGKEVATSGFRDTLSYGWLDKKAMEQATAVLSYFEDLGVDLNDLSEDELSTFAAKAFQAAKEAKSFADVMGTVKDVVATGWATTFEIIFGKLDKATEFFTWLTESDLANVIYSIGEFRNNMLKAWGSDPNDGGLFKVGGTGRDFLMASLKNLDAMIGKVHEGLASFGLIEYNKTLGRYLTFPEILGKRLALLTKRFNHFTVGVYNGVSNVVDKIVETYTWVRHVGNETTRTLKPKYEVRLQKITQGIASVFNVLSKLGGILGNTIGKVIIELLPVFEAVGDAIGTVLEPFTNLNNNDKFFQDLTNSIDNLLLVVQPLIEPISAFIRLLGQLGSIFIDLGISSVISSIDLFAETIGFVIELFGGTSAQKMNDGVGVIESWGEELKSFADTCKQGITAIKDFFTNLFADIKALFGIGEETAGQEGGFFENISKFFETNEFVQKVKAWVNKAITDVGNWIQDIPNKIRTLSVSVGDFFHGLFYTKNEEGAEIETSLKKWLDQLISNVGTFIQNIPQYVSSALHNAGNIISNIWTGLFYETKEVEVKRGPNKYLKTIKVKTPLKKWLDQALIDARNFIKNIPKNVISGIRSAGNVLRSLIGALFGKTDGSSVTSDDIVTALKKPFEGLSLSGFVSTIKTIGTEILNQVISMFTGTDDLEQNQATFAATVARGITWIGEKAKEAWDSATNFLINLPTTIANLFTGERTAEEIEAETKEAGPIESAINQFGKTVGGFILSIPDIILEFAGNVFTAIDQIWTSIYKSIVGEGDTQTTNPEEIKKQAEDNVSKAAPSDTEGATNGWKKFAEKVGKTIEGFFAKLPGWVISGLDIAVRLINEAIKGFADFIAGKTSDNDTPNPGETVIEGAAEATEQAEKQDITLLQTALQSLGDSMSTLITETIPGFLTTGWNYVSNNAGGWWEALTGIFDKYDISQLGAKINGIGENIERFIRGIPNYIRAGVEFIKGLFSGKKSVPDEIVQQVMEPKTKTGATFGKMLGNKLDKMLGSKDIHKAFSESGQELRYNFKTGMTEVSGGIEEEVEDGFNIWDTIRGIGVSIGDAFADIGPDILEGLNSAMQWVGDKISDATDFLAKGHEKGLKLSEMVFDDESEESNPILEKIRKLGQTLKTLIVETIPGFLKEAFTEISMSLPGIIESIFGGGDNLDTNTAEGAFEGAEKLVEEAGKVQDKAVKQAEQASGLNIFDMLFGWMIGSAHAEEAEDGVSEITEANDKVAAENEKLGETNKLYVDRIKKIEELKDRLSVVQETLAFAEADDRSTIDAATKEQEKLEKQIAILENLEDEMVDVALFDPELYGKNKDAAEKAGDSINGLFGVFEKIGSFMNSSGGSVIAGLGMLALVIHEFKDVISITDEIEGVGYTVKWDAIKIAVLGIVGILGWVTYLSSQTDANSETGRLKTTLNTLSALVDLLERIGMVAETLGKLKIGGNALEMVTSLFEMLGSRFDAKAAGKTGVVKSVGSSLGTSLSEFAIIAFGGEYIGKGLRSGFNYVWDSLVTLFTDAGIAINNAVSSIAPVVEELSNMDAQLDAAIRSVEKTMELVNKLRELVEGKSENNEAYYGNTDGATSLVEFQADYVNKVVTTFYQLGAAIHGLGTGLKSFGDLESSKKKISEIAALIASDEFKDMLQNMSDAFLWVAMPGVNDQFVETIGYLSSALNVLTLGVGNLSTTKVANISELFKMVNDLGSNAGEAGAKNDRLIGIGNGIQKLGINLRSFIRDISGVDQIIGTDEASIKRYQSIADLCMTIIGGIAKTIPDLEYIGDGSIMTTFSDHMLAFGSQVASFITALNDGISQDIDTGRIQVLSVGVKAIADLMTGVGALVSNSSLLPEDFPKFMAAFFKGVAENLEGENDFFSVGEKAGANLDAGLAAGISGGQAILAAQALAAAISGSFTVSWEMHSPSKLFEGFGEFLNLGLKKGIDENREEPISAAEAMAQDSVDNVTSILETIKDLAISDMDITPTITPVVDLSNVEHAAEQIQLLGFGGTPFQFDTSGLSGTANAANPAFTRTATPVSIDYSSLLGSIRGDLTALGSQISGMNNFSGMQVVLDTGAIVGGIIDEVDRQLGRRSFYAGREG